MWYERRSEEPEIGVRLSTLAPVYLECYVWYNGVVAHLGERTNGIREVAGSIPADSTRKKIGDALAG